MATLKSNTVVIDSNGQAVSLLEGADLPSWAKDQVGDHLLDDGSSSSSSDGGDAGPKPYSEWKFADLKAEITSRNEGRAEEDKINPEGSASIKSYAAALEADDAARVASTSEAGAGSGEDPGAEAAAEGASS
jgi:hypothetical protein